MPTRLTLIVFLLIAGAITPFGCASAPSAPQASTPATDLKRLASMMTGTFSSEAQAEADDGFFHIRLVMAPIWEARADGPWLYVEQAAAGSLDAPYRQRVYHLVEVGDGSIRSDVYELPDPAAFTGAWRRDDAFSGVSPDDLVLREGCSLVLRPTGGSRWAGATADRACPSELRGASYATSEAVITPEGMLSWDRGWNAQGEQVWGAVKGGYVFDRVSRQFPR